MGTIADYPAPSRTLDGGELLPLFQDGRQVAISVYHLLNGALPSPALAIGHYRYGGFAVGDILAGEVLLDHIVAAGHSLASDFAGCVASVGTPPASFWAAALTVNGQAAGALTVGTDGTSRFVNPWDRPVSVAVGDVVTITAPDAPDPTIARLRFTLSGVAV